MTVMTFLRLIFNVSDIDSYTTFFFFRCIIDIGIVFRFCQLFLGKNYDEIMKNFDEIYSEILRNIKERKTKKLKIEEWEKMNTFSNSCCKCRFSMIHMSDSTDITVRFSSVKYFFRAIKFLRYHTRQISPCTWLSIKLLKKKLL